MIIQPTYSQKPLGRIKFELSLNPCQEKAYKIQRKLKLMQTP
jgi:hypothetical protein